MFCGVCCLVCRCLLSVVRSVPAPVVCLLLVVCCLLFVVRVLRCLLCVCCVVRCLLCVACCVLFCVLLVGVLFVALFACCL